jgi:hypothetical protein
MTESTGATPPIERVSFRPEDFPFTIQLHDEETDELLWETEVTGAGALAVPGYAPRKVRVTLIEKDGSVSVMNSDGTSPDDDEQHQVLIACHPVDPAEYDHVRYQVWLKGLADVQAQGLLPPIVYGGSIEARCAECDIRVMVGPRQQGQLLILADAGTAAMITCLVCAPLLMSRWDADARVVQLGNPEDPNG